MRRRAVAELALVLLQRIGSGYADALCGDLLEELQRTGSTRRFWREVTTAVLRGLWLRCAPWLRPVVFSAAWSLLYPAWQAMEGGRVWPALAQRSYGMEFPYSSVALLASAGLSPLLYVWCGALVYMARNRSGGGAGVRWFHAVRGLSMSLSVLLLSWMALMRTTRGEGVAEGMAGVPGAGVHLSWFSVALMVSLLAATLPAGAQSPRPRVR